MSDQIAALLSAARASAQSADQARARLGEAIAARDAAFVRASAGGFSYAQIAGVTGMKRSAVQAAIERALGRRR